MLNSRFEKVNFTGSQLYYQGSLWELSSFDRHESQVKIEKSKSWNMWLFLIYKTYTLVFYTVKKNRSISSTNQ